MNIFRKLTNTLLMFLLLVLLLVIIIGGGISLGYLLYNMQDSNIDQIKQDIFIPVLVFFCCIIWLAILVLVLFLFKEVIKTINSVKHIFGADISIRFIGLAIISILFPRAIYSSIIAPIKFFIGVIYNIPNQLYLLINEKTNVSEGKSYDLNEIFQWLIFIIQFIGKILTDLINQFIDSVPITNLIIAIGLWILFSQSFSKGNNGQISDEIENSVGNTSKHFFKNIPVNVRYNILFSVIFIFSAYLCIVAIAALPWLQQEKQTEEINNERLKERLDRLIIPREEFDRNFPKNYLFETKPFEGLNKLLEIDSDSLGIIYPKFKVPEEFANRWDKKIKETQTQINLLNSVKDENLGKWNEYRNEVYQYQSNLIRNTLENFDDNLLIHMSDQERIQYFMTTDKWIKERINYLNEGLSIAMDYIKGVDKTLLLLSSNFISDIETALLEIKNYSQDTTKELPYIYTEDIFSSYSNISSVGNTYVFELPKYEVYPTPPEPGLGWGPFGLIAKWLLKTKSLELTLITGMLGFGLFGAAISSFIRRITNQQTGDDLDKNFVKIFLSGISAAIVIFLAVKGGIAIVVTGDKQPNPYVLFFSCLVGAVFSEDVWTWARKKFPTSFKGGDSNSEIIKPVK